MRWKKPKDYYRMITSSRWVALRNEYLRDHPLCERCLEEGKAAGVPLGYIKSAELVHHRKPVESAHTDKEMEQLCFSYSNLQALCKKCHAKVHHELLSQTREGHQQAADNNLERWKARKKGRPTP